MNSYNFKLQWVNCAACKTLWGITNRHTGPVVLGFRHIATESRFTCLRNYSVKKVKTCINFCYILFALVIFELIIYNFLCMSSSCATVQCVRRPPLQFPPLAPILPFSPPITNTPCLQIFLLVRYRCSRPAAIVRSFSTVRNFYGVISR
jgi:hypothetical protein